MAGEMRDYELVTIINPDVDEDEVSNTTEKVAKCISSRGGVVGESDKWGKRKLAYPLKKFMEGNYMLTWFKMEPGLVKEVERELMSWEEILRFLIIKVED